MLSSSTLPPSPSPLPAVLRDIPAELSRLAVPGGIEPMSKGVYGFAGLAPACHVAASPGCDAGEVVDMSTRRIGIVASIAPRL